MGLGPRVLGYGARAKGFRFRVVGLFSFRAVGF